MRCQNRRTSRKNDCWLIIDPYTVSEAISTIFRVFFFFANGIDGCAAGQSPVLSQLQPGLDFVKNYERSALCVRRKALQNTGDGMLALT